MRYTALSSSFYKKNRTNFAKQLKSKGLAVFTSNDIYPTSADGTLPFKQHSDLFYLTGVDQEETLLIIFPEAQNPAHREMLFVRETNEHIAIWEGAKLSKLQATERTGIQSVFWAQDFEKMLHAVMGEAQCLYLNSNEHSRASIEVETREMRLSKQLRMKYPHHNIERCAPIMHALRAVKDDEEINQIQRAIDLTNQGLRRVMKMLKPGVMEYQIEAEFAHEFISHGSRGFAYTPIVASGKNACVLHYIENDHACNEGDVILLDVGAEFGGYNADMTRCLPVSGKFTQRQKDVYNAVLRVMKAATAYLKPGVMLAEYHTAVGEMMTKELLDLKLITSDEVKNQNPAWPAYKKYFMHGTSHFLGLDVHDVGNWNKPIEVGNVFTVEPGIYILEENLGIRLENNIVITENGNRDLFANFPLEVEEIEELMAQQS
jgi:Xaa-Pro aminopeptidase